MFEEDIPISPHFIFLGLIQLDGVGFQTIYNFFNDEKSLSDLMRTENFNDFFQLLGRKINNENENFNNFNNFINNIIKNGEEYLKKLNNRGIEFLLYSDYNFPLFPSNMKMPIYWLFIEGKLDNLQVNNALTLIGSRESSEIGFFLAQTLLFGISNTKESVVTISGLAAGIDQIVHETSLFLGIPTIAVLGNGLDENYPSNSKQLRQDIVKAGGTIITEYFPNMKPSKESFVHRNRIQAALASTVIPLQWKQKSGTAHTIRFAYEMKKQICFVETNICRKFFTEHALANSSAQRNYGGDIFILPNAINELIESLELNINEEVVFHSKQKLALKEDNVCKQPSQMGLDF
ncbi:DNA-protecting protein DprA [Acinetobacter lwoffii]|uniref:DNA-processing protein DprA n=1 Tax=Acinetobacter lwoffii TaxID=28090 RepID=UPI00209AC637|nr:DNA-processing protein DprA [Acinetobacter lwoffii]MCO8115526.1 DNA-protecting protein DprA [Acinetobacter lwoffii]